MAIMGRTKRANAQGWNATNKQRDKEIQAEPKKEEKKISKEEMEKLIKMVKEATTKKD